MTRRWRPAQTVTPQAVCAGSNRSNAWVGILLPVPAAATYSPPNVRPRRAAPLRVARTRQTVPVRAQVNPPNPIQEIAQPRRTRGLLLRRGKLAQTVPPQFNPPNPFAEVVQPRRLHGIKLRRGKQSTPPWVGASPPSNPDLVSQLPRLPRLLGWAHRGHQVVPPAATSPSVGVKRDRPVVLLIRRGRGAQPVPVPPTPVNPGWIPDHLRERVRLVVLRHGRAGPVPPGQALAPPPPTGQLSGSAIALGGTEAGSAVSAAESEAGSAVSAAESASTAVSGGIQ